MKKFSFSSKMHIFIIVSCVIIVLGLAIGLVCQFTAGGFFNYGGDNASYQTVSVQYYERVTSTDAVEEICDDAFSANGVSYYAKTYSDTTNGSEIVYRFSTSQDSAAIQNAATTIANSVNSDTWFLGGAYYSSQEAAIGGGRTLMWAGIAVASAVVFQFIYFLIRYKLMMACAAVIADVHNLALYLAILAITRLQASSAVFALGVFVVLLTMAGVSVLFDRLRRNFRTEEYKAMPSLEQTDAAVSECFPLVTTMYAVLAAVIAVVMIFTTIGAMSVYSIFMPCIAAIIAVLVCEYGTMLFIPSVYSRFKLKADERAKLKDKKVRSEKPKKKPEAKAEGSSAE